MEEIIYSDEFHQALEELIVILFDEEYFGFLSSSVTYVFKIYEFVDQSLMLPISKKSPFAFRNMVSFTLGTKPTTVQPGKFSLTKEKTDF